MEKGRVGEGARALLFERLVDENPRTQAEQRPLRTHDSEGLRTSVLRRLDLLLNTRATRTRPADGPLTVLDYGLPDYSATYTRDSRTQALLAREIRRTIEAFEPRFVVDDVVIKPTSENDRSLMVALSGRLRSESTIEPVAFSIPLAGEGTPERSS